MMPPLKAEFRSGWKASAAGRRNLDGSGDPRGLSALKKLSKKLKKRDVTFKVPEAGQGRGLKKANAVGLPACLPACLPTKARPPAKPKKAR
jgi:hypothetical protein